MSARHDDGVLRRRINAHDHRELRGQRLTPSGCRSKNLDDFGPHNSCRPVSLHDIDATPLAVLEIARVQPGARFAIVHPINSAGKFEHSDSPFVIKGNYLRPFLTPTRRNGAA